MKVMRQFNMKRMFTLLTTMATISSAFVSPERHGRKEQAPVILAGFGDNNKGGHVNKPPLLDGTYAGDFGFDPLGFVRTKEDLVWYREAEMKHARLVRLDGGIALELLVSSIDLPFVCLVHRQCLLQLVGP